MCTEKDLNKSYQRLEHSLTDVIAEEQAKLGYMKEAMRLYYPLNSLNHFFDSNASADEMLSRLSAFPDFCSERLGTLKISHDGDIFCFYLAPEASEYVHLNKAENEFIFKLVELLQKHGTTLDDVIAFFRKYNDSCVVAEVNNNEFDILIRFTDGADSYYYCFKDEGCHVIYHRFTPEDYMDFGF